MKSIGVHTTAQAVRVAELTRTGESVHVVRLHTIGAAASGAKAAAGATRVVRTACYASLPPVEVLTRVWTLPAVSPLKLRAMIAHRLEADLPIPIEQLEWSCRATPADHAGEAIALAQAVRRDRLSRLIDSLHAADLTPTTITTEAEGLAALASDALSIRPEAGTVALVLAGHSEWTLILLAGGLVRALRRTNINSETSDAAVREFEQTIRAQAGQTGVSRLIWIGSQQSEEPLGVLADALGATLTSVAADLRHESGEKIGPDELVEYAVAIGLALASLNQREDLIRLGGLALDAAGGPQTRIEKLLAHPKRVTAVVGGLAVLALLVQTLATRSETRRITATLASVQTRPAAGLDDKVRAMQRLERYRIDIESIMKEVARVLPDSTNITSVQLSRDKKLLLKGTSKDNKAAFTLADALDKSPRFANVSPDRTPGQDGTFSLTAEIAGVQKLTATAARGATWR